MYQMLGHSINEWILYSIEIFYENMILLIYSCFVNYGH